MILTNNTVNDIRNIFIDDYKNKRFIKDKTGCNVIEIINAQFIADEETIFGEVNKEYVQRELKWYLSESLNVNDLEKTPKIWKQVSDKDGFINSNYGWCILSKENYNQYKNCLKELQQNKDSRRAVMIYNRPNMWIDYNKNGRNDFMCTWGTQYFIRNNKLITIVIQRSMDSIFGYKNDRFWQDYVSTKLANDLKIEKGIIIWNAINVHVYENHFNLIENYINMNIEEEKDRNKCVETLCIFKKIIDEKYGVEYEQCTRCGRKRNLSYRV